MFFDMNKSKPLIGLDIGSHTLKVVELKPGRKGHRLVNLGLANLPPEAIVDGALGDPSKAPRRVMLRVLPSDNRALT